MRAIIKKIGLLISTMAAFVSTGCNKDQQTNDPATNNQNTQNAAQADSMPEDDGAPVAIYGMPSDFGMPEANDQPTEVVREPEPLPSNESFGIMALYGMPPELDDVQNPPVAESPKDEANIPAPIYGMLPTPDDAKSVADPVPPPPPKPLKNNSANRPAPIYGMPPTNFRD